MTLALLINSQSRMVRQHPDYSHQLEKAFGDRGPFFVSRNASELPATLADICRARPRVLFICGGDGTLRQTLTRAMGAYGDQPLPKIAILRGGTMNLVASSLNIHRPPLPHLKILLEHVDQAIPLETVQRHLLRIDKQYGFVFAIGGFSHFIEHYNAHENPGALVGLKLIAQVTLSSFMGSALSKSIFKRFSANVWRDGKPIIRGSLVSTISASTIRHIGFNFKPYCGAEQPGTMGLLVLRKSPKVLVNHLFEIYRGELVSDSDMDQLPAGEVLIKVKTALRPMIDGDILSPRKEFRLSCGPEVDMVVG